MIKTEMIKKVEQIGKMSRSEATVAVESVFQVLTEAITNREDVVIRNFGTFKVKLYQGKRAMNLAAGEQVMIPPTYRVKLNLTKEIRTKMNKRK